MKEVKKYETHKRMDEKKMNFSTIPLIVIVCYIISEILKQLLKKKKETQRMIPLIIALLGGLFGALIYLDDPKSILNAPSIYVAMEIGIISGTSATGTNQTIKQIFNKEKKEI